MDRRTTASGIATALLAGPWRRREMVRRVAVALGQQRARRWVGTLVADVLEAYAAPPVDRPRELAAFVRTTRGWATAQEEDPGTRVVRRAPRPTAVDPTRGLHRRLPDLAELDDLAALARLLDVDAGELAWFADTRSLERRAAEPLRHYRWRVVERPGGAVRLLAAPKPRLREIQRRLLRHLLAPVPVHDAAHGCVPGRSVRTALAPHAGAPLLLRADVEAFFPAVTAGRVWGLLQGTVGLTEPVAHAVTGLVTTVVPAEVWARVPWPGTSPARDRHARLGRRLAAPHLPAGAPTSPALANLVAHRLDRRLAGLAERSGARYTRYVDDLLFSGPRRLRGGLLAAVGVIAAEEGFPLHPGKTRVVGAGRRQSALGAVVNDHVTLPRTERDALRALLHNCAVHGWATQVRGQDPATFRDHVLGRVAHAAALDPAFGERLHRLAARVDWQAPS